MAYRSRAVRNLFHLLFILGTVSCAHLKYEKKLPEPRLETNGTANDTSYILDISPKDFSFYKDTIKTNKKNEIQDVPYGYILEGHDQAEAVCSLKMLEFQTKNLDYIWPSNLSKLLQLSTYAFVNDLKGKFLIHSNIDDDINILHLAGISPLSSKHTFANELSVEVDRKTGLPKKFDLRQYEATIKKPTNSFDNSSVSKNKLLTEIKCTNLHVVSKCSNWVYKFTNKVNDQSNLPECSLID